jgi:hypothetical protein
LAHEVNEEHKKLQENIREKNRRLKKLRERLESKDREIEALRARLVGGDETGIQPGNIVWIFGAGRTGSTWLASMMAELDDCVMWHEPLVGELFGYLYYVRAWEGHYSNKNFILGRHRETWLNSIRSFVLAGANARFPEVADGGYLVVKEPNGSIGAPLLMEALPESRMILLVRDPRDVAASVLDAVREGGWFYERRGKGQDAETFAAGNPHPFFREESGAFAQSLGKAKEAYEAHEGRKALVRYEDLREDTLGTMKRMYSRLEVPVDEERLVLAAEKHSWENIPEEERGKGKFLRKGTPGSWKEDLTPEQAETVERLTGPLLDEFYPGWRDE